MKIIVNGEEREVLEGMTVFGLLDGLSINKERVAVEINLDMVPRSRFDDAVLKEWDRVEIVNFVGGG